jgi:hypothetical protein
MATDLDIRDAERAQLEAVVAELGSEGEQVELMLSRILRNGTLEGVLSLPPDPGTLKLLARRAERRSRLGLPQAPCAGDPPTHSCECLIEALDQEGDGGKRHVLKAAAELHWAPPPRRERARPEPEEESQAEAPPSRPKAQAPLRREPDEKFDPATFRPVKRFPKWFDRDDEGPSGFASTRF